MHMRTACGGDSSAAFFLQEKAVGEKCLHFVSICHSPVQHSLSVCLSSPPTGEFPPCRWCSTAKAWCPCVMWSVTAGHKLSLLARDLFQEWRGSLEAVCEGFIFPTASPSAKRGLEEKGWLLCSHIDCLGGIFRRALILTGKWGRGGYIAGVEWEQVFQPFWLQAKNYPRAVNRRCRNCGALVSPFLEIAAEFSTGGSTDI